MLDAGLVSVLSPENLRNFLDLFSAVSSFNGKKVARLMIERSKTPETALDTDMFVSDMDAFLRRIQADTLSLAKVRLGDILATVFGMVRRHHVRMDGDFANVGISIMLLEGIISLGY
jgi:aarF domain-containing kinase